MLLVGGVAAVGVALAFTFSFALGVRTQLGHDDRATRGLYALLKADRKIPRRLGWVPAWAWIAAAVPAIVGTHLLVLLPLFAGAAAMGRLGYREDAGPSSAADRGGA